MFAMYLHGKRKRIEKELFLGHIEKELEVWNEKQELGKNKGSESNIIHTHDLHKIEFRERGWNNPKGNFTK